MREARMVAALRDDPAATKPISHDEVVILTHEHGQRVSRYTIQSWESGDVVPLSDTLAHVAGSLGVELDFFFVDEDR